MKTKKIAAIFLVIVLCVTFVGCQRARINENNQLIAKRVVKACTSYLDGDIDAGTLLAQVEKELDNVDKEFAEGNESGLSLHTELLLFKIHFSDAPVVSTVKDFKKEVSKLAGL